MSMSRGDICICCRKYSNEDYSLSLFKEIQMNVMY